MRKLLLCTQRVFVFAECWKHLNSYNCITIKWANIPPTQTAGSLYTHSLAGCLPNGSSISCSIGRLRKAFACQSATTAAGFATRRGEPQQVGGHTTEGKLCKSLRDNKMWPSGVHWLYQGRYLSYCWWCCWGGAEEEGGRRICLVMGRWWLMRKIISIHSVGEKTAANVKWKRKVKKVIRR